MNRRYPTIGAILIISIISPLYFTASDNIHYSIDIDIISHADGEFTGRNSTYAVDLDDNGVIDGYWIEIEINVTNPGLILIQDFQTWDIHYNSSYGVAQSYINLAGYYNEITITGLYNISHFMSVSTIGNYIDGEPVESVFFSFSGEISFLYSNLTKYAEYDIPDIELNFTQAELLLLGRSTYSRTFTPLENAILSMSGTTIEPPKLWSWDYIVSEDMSDKRILGNSTAAVNETINIDYGTGSTTGIYVNGSQNITVLPALPFATFFIPQNSNQSLVHNWLQQEHYSMILFAKNFNGTAIEYFHPLSDQYAGYQLIVDLEINCYIFQLNITKVYDIENGTLIYENKSYNDNDDSSYYNLRSKNNTLPTWIHTIPDYTFKNHSCDVETSSTSSSSLISSTTTTSSTSTTLISSGTSESETLTSDSPIASSTVPETSDGTTSTNSDNLSTKAPGLVILAMMLVANRARMKRRERLPYLFDDVI